MDILDSRPGTREQANKGVILLKSKEMDEFLIGCFCSCQRQYCMDKQFFQLNNVLQNVYVESILTILLENDNL